MSYFCRTLGPINFSFWYLFKTNKKQEKMTEIIPYFAGLITIVFGLSFFFIIKENNED